MTGGPDHPVLRFTADLRLDVDGIQAQIRADGSEMVVETDRPVQLGRALARGYQVRTLPDGVPRRRKVLTAAGDRLAEHGVSVRLVGPDGTVARIGSGVDSAFGAVLTGSRRVQFARPGALPALVPRRAALAGVGVLAAAAAAVAVLRRRRTS